jgi:hypothetical protein
MILDRRPSPAVTLGTRSSSLAGGNGHELPVHCFDRGLLTPPAVRTWPLKDSVLAYQAVLYGSAGIRQVLLPNG